MSQYKIPDHVTSVTKVTQSVRNLSVKYMGSIRFYLCIKQNELTDSDVNIHKSQKLFNTYVHLHSPAILLGTLVQLLGNTNG